MARLHFAILTLICVVCLGGHARAQNLKIGVEQDLSNPLLNDIVSGFVVANRGKTVRTVAADGTVAFEVSTPADLDARWTTYSGSSARLMDAMLAKDLDIALVSRPLSSAMVGAFRARGLGDPQSPALRRTLGITPLVPVVSPKVALTEISEIGLARVLAGDVTDWVDLGDDPAPIRLFLSRQNTMAQEVLARTLGADVLFHEGAQWLDTDAQVALAVAQWPGAIGLIAQRSAFGVRPLTLLDACGAAWPSDIFAVKSGTYPYSKTLSVMRAGAERRAATDLLWGYLVSPKMTPILNLAGLADARVETRKLTDMGARLAASITNMQTEATLSELRAMMTVLQGAKRLSLTFRMDGGREVLDRRSSAKLLALVSYLKEQQMRNPELILAGFTDNLGLGSQNAEKSLQDATLIANHLRVMLAQNLPDLALSAHGFGEIAPLVCNDHEANRAINRRVEVWVR